MYWDMEDMGTPSAPPIMETGQEDNSLEIETEIEQIEDEICREAGVESNQGNMGCIADDKSWHLYRDAEFVER